MTMMSIHEAIKEAARIAARAKYSGRVVIYNEGDGHGVAEFSDGLSYTPGMQELISINTSPYEPETPEALEKYLCKQLSIKPIKPTWTINYNNGCTVEHVGTLASAKRAASAGASYTQCNITIEDAHGHPVARRKWCMIGRDNVARNPIYFGSFGFYGDWENI